MNCPDCDEEMVEEETCQDSWNYSNDMHTTIDGKVWVCPNCKKEIEDDYDPDGGDQAYEMDRDDRAIAELEKEE